MTHLQLEGTTAIVTGSSGHLGPVWISGLLDAGCTVVAIDRPDAPASCVIERLRAQHAPRLLTAKADVRNRAELESQMSSALAELPPPGVLVNNAGIDHPPTSAATFRVEDYPQELFEQILGVNVLGLFNVCQAVGARMIAGGGGSIVNIGSLYASVSPDPRYYDHLATDPPFLKSPAYGASKAAVHNLSRYLAVHWAASRVRVNTLSPGGVMGHQDAEFLEKFRNRVPMRRMAQAADLVGPLLFLASSDSAYVTGQELLIDGGFTAL